MLVIGFHTFFIYRRILRVGKALCDALAIKREKLVILPGITFCFCLHVVQSAFHRLLQIGNFTEQRFKIESDIFIVVKKGFIDRIPYHNFVDLDRIHRQKFDLCRGS